MITLTQKQADRYLAGRTIRRVDVERLDADDTNAKLNAANAVTRLVLDK